MLLGIINAFWNFFCFLLEVPELLEVIFHAIDNVNNNKKTK